MPNFTYKVRDKSGKLVDGVFEADSQRSMIDKLREMGYFVVSVKEEERPSIFKIDILEKLRKIKARELVVVNRQLATMIRSGLTLSASLNVLYEQIESQKLKRIMEEVRNDVEGGASFSDSLSKHPEAFSELFISMVRAGEAGGILEEVLERIATLSEEEEELRSSVKTALIYPVVIVLVAIAVVTFLVMKVIPMFAHFFKGRGELPLPTTMLINLSNFLRSYWLYGLAIIIGIVVFLYRYSRTGTGRETLDKFKLEIPILGLIIKKAILSRFARTFGALVRSGVPILESLRIVKEAMGNVIMAKVIDKTCERVNKGENISSSLQESDLFPPIVGQMVAVGEETGALDSVLGNLADLYDRDVSTMVKRLTSLIEPILILVIGGIVAFIALSMYLPMFRMFQVVR